MPQTHPCIAQYGSCIYGDTCSLAAFPAAACVYHLQMQIGKGTGCIYGDECRNSHIDISSFVMDPGEELNDSFDKPALSLYYQKTAIQSQFNIPSNYPHLHQSHVGRVGMCSIGSGMGGHLPKKSEIPPSRNSIQMNEQSHLSLENNPTKKVHLEEISQWCQFNKNQTVKIHTENIIDLSIAPHEDNPWCIKEVKYKISVPDLYPLVLPNIEVTNPEFPNELKNTMNKKISLKLNSIGSGRNEILYNTLCWIQANLGDLLIYRNILPNELPEDDALIQNVVNVALKDENENEKEEDDEDDQKLTGYSNGQAQVVSKSLGVQFFCEDVEMLGVGLMECYVIKITVTCSRCKTASDLQISENTPFTSICGKCQQPFGSLWAPAHILVAIHQSNNKLGELELQNIVLKDILPSCFKITCLNCNLVNMDKNLVIGDNSQTNCRECHKLLKYKIDSLDVKNFEKISTIDLEKTKQLKGNKNKKVSEGIIRGESLPKNGSCNHYKKSKRWERYPCCHKTYPCHQCHDLASDHAADWANRMICGFCSTEQAMDDQCKKCGLELVSIKQATAHWEGGQGKRDQTTMSKKDSKKYRGLNKTSPTTQPKK